MFFIEAQGSCGAKTSPCCSSSIEMLSGDLIKAILPSRGGRSIVTPENISIELLQQGDVLAPQEPWASMKNTGEW